MRSYRDPRTVAENILLRAGSPRLENGFAIDIRGILERFCGFQVAIVPNLNLGRSLLAAFIPSETLVMVEHHCIPVRQRFSMAHELGHAQLENDFGDSDMLIPVQQQTFFRCADSDIDIRDEKSAGLKRRAEIRANQFAAALLMPQALVREAWRLHRDERRCADALDVSNQSMHYRLIEIGLISD
jgi:Zn-dependent peptidase ImmA (M78 family)